LPSVDATRPARPAWRRWTLGATCLAALLALIPGPMLGRMPTTLWSVALAMTAAVFAQFASFRFRQGDRTVLFGWGEAALIIVVYLVPTGWVGPVIGVGSLIGHSLYLLRTNAAWTPTKLMSVTNLAVAGAIGAIAARLVGPAAPAITPRMIVALVAGAAAYTVVGAVLVNAVLVTSAADPFWRAVARTLWDKLPIIAGNVAIGLTVVVLLVVDKRWLLLTPPLVVSMRQLYVYRSRDADERRIWREYADIARALHQLDERGVAIAGAEGAIRLFHAAAVEVWVDRLAGTVRGFRGTPGAGGVDVVPLVGGDGGWRTEPSATRRLSIGGVRVGEIRLWMRAGMMLDGRDQMVFAAVADALAAALHDATAHRALRTLAARTFHDANHDVLTGIANRATLMRDGCELLERLPEHGRLSLTVLDINRFKDVNDTLGHLAGDELLHHGPACVMRAGDGHAMAGVQDLDDRSIGSAGQRGAQFSGRARYHPRCHRPRPQDCGGPPPSARRCRVPWRAPMRCTARRRRARSGRGQMVTGCRRCARPHRVRRTWCARSSASEKAALRRTRQWQDHRSRAPRRSWRQRLWRTVRKARLASGAVGGWDSTHRAPPGIRPGPRPHLPAHRLQARPSAQPGSQKAVPAPAASPPANPPPQAAPPRTRHRSAAHPGGSATGDSACHHPERRGRSQRYTRLGEDLGQPPQPSMGGHPDRTGAAPDHPRHRFGIQPGHHPQQDHFRLEGRQRRHQRHRRPRVKALDRYLSRILRYRQPGRRHLIQRCRGPSGTAPALVDRAAAGGREQPRPPGLLIPAEAGQAAHHLHPGLGRDVLRCIRRDHPQIAQQRRIAVPPQPRERRLAALLRGDQDRRKSVADHSAEYRQPGHPAAADPAS
jgi:hypothetical protein